MPRQTMRIVMPPSGTEASPASRSRPRVVSPRRIRSSARSHSFMAGSVGARDEPGQDDCQVVVNEYEYEDDSYRAAVAGYASGPGSGTSSRSLWTIESGVRPSESA